MSHSTPDANADFAEAIDNGSHHVETEPSLMMELPGMPPEIVVACDRLAELLNPEERPDYPRTGVTEHLDSLHGLVTSMREAGEISEPIDRTLRVFIETHDYAYSIDSELYASYPKEHIEALRTTGIASGLRYREANERAIALYEYLVRYGGDPAIGKVIAHGANAIPNAVCQFTEAGLSEEQATGMALIFTAHHPGYPIDFVANELLRMELPNEFRPLLLIDDGVGGDPNRFRRKIADHAAKLAQIPKHDARMLAALGYGIDRITPMRPPDDVRYATDGEFKVIGGEFFQKKLSLIVPGLLRGNRLEDCTYEDLLSAALEQVEREAAEAVIAARTLHVPELIPVLERTTARELERTRATNNELRFALREMVGKELSGNFAGIKPDINWLRAIGRDRSQRLLLGVLESVEPVVNRVTTLLSSDSSKE